MVDNAANSKDMNSNGSGDTTPQHEPDSLWTGWMASIGAGLLLLAIATLIGIAVAFQTLVPDRPVIGAGDAWTQQQAPGVHPNQAYDREHLLNEEEMFLKQYAWEDQDKGIARIPIERGIEIMAKHKLKAEWPAAETAGSKDKEAE